MFPKVESGTIRTPESIVPKLREITNRLAGTPETKIFPLGQDSFSVVKSLCSKGMVGVVDAIIPEGLKFPTHLHEEPIIEYLIVYKGRLSVKVDEKDAVEVGVGEFCRFAEGVIHTVTAMEGYGDAEMIGITVPKDPGYPAHE